MSKERNIYFHKMQNLEQDIQTGHSYSYLPLEFDSLLTAVEVNNHFRRKCIIAFPTVKQNIWHIILTAIQRQCTNITSLKLSKPRNCLINLHLIVDQRTKTLNKLLSKIYAPQQLDIQSTPCLSLQRDHIIQKGVVPQIVLRHYNPTSLPLHKTLLFSCITQPMPKLGKYATTQQLHSEEVKIGWLFLFFTRVENLLQESLFCEGYLLSRLC